MKPIPPGPFEPRDPRTDQIIGAALAVHRELGPGFLEPVYQEALSIELDRRGVLHQREVEVPVFYPGERLSAAYRADFICYGEVLVEIKALGELTPREQRQVIHYLKATRLETALLMNFGARSLQFHRFVNSRRHVATGTESV